MDHNIVPTYYNNEYVYIRRLLVNIYFGILHYFLYLNSLQFFMSMDIFLTQKYSRGASISL